MKRKYSAPPKYKKKTYTKKAKVDPLARWAIEPGFKENVKRDDTDLGVISAGGLQFGTSSSVASTLLLTVPLGTNEYQRNGARIRLQSWRFRGFVAPDPSTLATTPYFNDHLRVIFFYDRQTNGVAPTFAQVAQSIQSGLSNSLSNPNWLNRGRFKIIRDFNIPTPAFSASIAVATPIYPTGSPVQMTSAETKVDFYKNFKGKLDTVYLSNSSGPADISAGGLFMVIQSLNGTPWLINGTSSIEFMDH